MTTKHTKTYSCPTCQATVTVHIPTTAIACTGGRRHKPVEMVPVVEEPLDAARPSN